MIYFTREYSWAVYTTFIGVPVNFGCDGAGDVIYFTSNHLGISPSLVDYLSATDYGLDFFLTTR